jgi:hypothetical protein
MIKAGSQRNNRNKSKVHSKKTAKSGSNRSRQPVQVEETARNLCVTSSPRKYAPAAPRLEKARRHY